MLISVPELIDCCALNRITKISTVIIVLWLNVCILMNGIAEAGPTSQQEQELMLLDALSKRQPSYYGTSNSIMDILGRSRFCLIHIPPRLHRIDRSNRLSIKRIREHRPLQLHWIKKERERKKLKIINNSIIFNGATVMDLHKFMVFLFQYHVANEENNWSVGYWFVVDPVRWSHPTSLKFYFLSIIIN